MVEKQRRFGNSVHRISKHPLIKAELFSSLVLALYIRKVKKSGKTDFVSVFLSHLLVLKEFCKKEMSSIYRTRSGPMLIIFDQPLFQLITLLLCGRNLLFKVETYCSRTGAYCYGVKTYYNQQ